ncbi:hypothetical protein ACWENQ_44800 [Nonomuraea sp. NPDC004354]
MIDDLAALYMLRARAVPIPTSPQEGHMKIFGREPALWLSLIQTAVALAVGLGLSLTGDQVGLINGAAAAVLALIAAFAVRPFPVPLLMGAIQALLALAVGFGLELTGEQVGLANAAAAALVGFILRMHVEPVDPRTSVRGAHAGVDIANL